METHVGLDYTAVFAVLSELVESGLVVVNPTGEMDFASGRARLLLGCGDDLTIGACHKDIRSTIAEIVQDVHSRSAHSTQKNVRFEADGKARDLVLEGHKIDENACSGVLILVKDASSMQRMAQDLQMSAQFRNTRRLYQAVVHDLRQPISAIMVHLDLLRDRIAVDNRESDDNPRVRSLQVIKNQVSDLSRTLTLLLEEIHPSGGEERGYSLRDVLEDVIRLVEPQAAQQNVNVNVVTCDHAGRMNGSRQRVKQALLNLAVNSLDAMDGGGDLDVEFNVEGGEASITFRDSGVGIEPDVLPHIFEMHYTTKTVGTGVGLYVARDVVERHGGRIEVDAEPGRNTAFTVILPVSMNGS